MDACTRVDPITINFVPRLKCRADTVLVQTPIQQIYLNMSSRTVSHQLSHAGWCFKFTHKYVKLRWCKFSMTGIKNYDIGIALFKLLKKE